MRRAFFLSMLVVTTGAVAANAQFSTSSSAFGQRTFGSGVSGSAASAQANRSQGLTQSGQVSAEGAIQRDAGGFVGASSSNAVNILGAQSGLGGLGGFGSTLGGFGGGFGRSGFGGGYGGFGGQQNAQNLNSGQTQTRGDLRIPMTIGFARPSSVANASVASIRLAERLKNIRQVEAVDTIAVSAVGRTVVLRGTVVSEHARSLAERVALLEPGVSEVRNELVVAPHVLPPGN